MTIEEIKKEILNQTEKSAKKVFGEHPENIKLDFPPDTKLGNFSLGCFVLAKQFKKSPAEIAKSLANEIEVNEIIEKVQATGPYINFRISPAVLFGGVCNEIISEADNFGKTNIGDDQRVMVEYLSPNTNKPLHLGHIRNGALGMAVSSLLIKTGHTTIKANLVNDRGVHICKSMLAWTKFANGETPESSKMKGDHFVGKWYVKFSEEAEKNPELENEVQEMLKKWEEGDEEVVELWKKMNNWVYEGFEETYKKLGLEFDAFYYESNTYKLGKGIISEGIEKEVFHKDDKGASVFNLPVEEFGENKDGSPKKVTVLRPDGTSVYITQDIGTALKKVSDHNLNQSIYVVGSEQEHHFKCLFKILESLGYDWAKNCHHLSYGMVYLPEGKMKSREGKVVDADDLVAKMTKLALEEIKKRDAKNNFSDSEAEKRASKIALGAIKFYLLKVGPTQDIHFDPEESLSFEGFTGPYCQYSYARTAGILSNIKETDTKPENLDFSILGSKEELLLAQKLIQFPEVVKIATKDLNPSRIAIHTFETAKAFNQFYHKNPVLNTKDNKLKEARLALVKASAITLKNGLKLLGIEVMDKM